MSCGTSAICQCPKRSHCLGLWFGHIVSRIVQRHGPHTPELGFWYQSLVDFDDMFSLFENQDGDFRMFLPHFPKSPIYQRQPTPGPWLEYINTPVVPQLALHTIQGGFCSKKINSKRSYVSFRSSTRGCRMLCGASPNSQVTKNGSPITQCLLPPDPFCTCSKSTLIETHGRECFARREPLFAAIHVWSRLQLSSEHYSRA